MANVEAPFWYGGHDNPHHAGMISHLKRLAATEDQLMEFTGVKGKHISLGRLSQREITKKVKPNPNI